MKHYKQLIAYAAVALYAVVLTVGTTGCNTTEGVGKDIQSAGKGIEDAAD